MTPLQRHLSREEMHASGWLDDDGNPVGQFKTPEQGAATSVWAATSPQLDGMGGVYCADCDIADIGREHRARRWRRDRPRGRPRRRRPPVDVSAELSGVDAFAKAA